MDTLQEWVSARWHTAVPPLAQRSLAIRPTTFWLFFIILNKVSFESIAYTKPNTQLKNDIKSNCVFRVIWFSLNY